MNWDFIVGILACYVLGSFTGVALVIGVVAVLDRLGVVRRDDPSRYPDEYWQSPHLGLRDDDRQ